MTKAPSGAFFFAWRFVWSIFDRFSAGRVPLRFRAFIHRLFPQLPRNAVSKPQALRRSELAREPLFQVPADTGCSRASSPPTGKVQPRGVQVWCVRTRGAQAGGGLQPRYWPLRGVRTGSWKSAESLAVTGFQAVSRGAVRHQGRSWHALCNIPGNSDFRGLGTGRLGNPSFTTCERATRSGGRRNRFGGPGTGRPGKPPFYARRRVHGAPRTR